MLYELNKFLGDWQYLWFFAILFLGLLVELHSNYMLRKEFDYDKAKDDKRIRRKTTKRTTKNIDGSVTEEQSEEVTSHNGDANESQSQTKV